MAGAHGGNVRRGGILGFDVHDLGDETAATVLELADRLSAGAHRNVAVHGASPCTQKTRSGPVSRVLSGTTIYLAYASPRSSTHATRVRAGPTHRTPICACSGWGLPSRPVARTLVVSYTTVSAFPFTLARRWESSFLRRFPSDHSARPLAGILPYGARTFLTRALQRTPRAAV